MKETVLIYIEKDNQYLLIHKTKKNDLNYDKYLGIGGKIEDNETPIEAVIRETKEESSLDLLEVKERGIIYFYNDDYIEKMYLFTSSSFTGTLTNTCIEGELKFINKEDILSLNIWEGDKIFLQLLKEDKPYFILNLYYINNIFQRYDIIY